jgi:hypothetical protein
MERPIFHDLKNRTQTHIFLCVLAYHLLAAIEHRFLQVRIHTSWWTIRQQLSIHQIVTVVNRWSRLENPESHGARTGTPPHLQQASNPSRRHETREDLAQPSRIVPKKILEQRIFIRKLRKSGVVARKVNATASAGSNRDVTSQNRTSGPREIT